MRRIDSQHPGHTTMKLGIDTLEIGERNLLPQDHLVETDDEVGIEEASVEDGETEDTADELEVIEMLRVNT